MSAGYERQDAPPKLAAGGLLGVLALVVVCALAVLVMLYVFQSRRHEPALTAIEQTRPAPSQPLPSRAEVEAPIRARLNSAGPGHIPIGEAMALQARRGWPDGQAGR